MVITRKMQERDIAEIAQLEREDFSDPWSEKSLLDSLRQTFSYCMVAIEDEAITGYLIFYKNLDEGEILRIAVKKSHQRTGVGTQIIADMIRYCAQDRIRRVRLDVRRSNRRARDFYKKQGFVQDGMRKHFYTNPDEEAILMSRRI